MKVKIEIDTSDILRYTSYKEDQEIAKEFIENLSDEDIINEVLNRGILEDIIEELTEDQQRELLKQYI
jgi:hypothetical protein